MARDKRPFGTIRRLPSGRYQALYTAPARRRLSAPHTFAARIDAEGWLHQRRVEAEAGRWNPGATAKPAQVTFGVYAATLAGGAPRGGPADQGPHPRALRGHPGGPPAAHVRVSQIAGAIAPKDVRDWHAATLTDRPTMRSHAYSLLRTIFASAVNDELIDANPCRIVGAGRAKRVHKIRPASVEELAALTTPCPSGCA